MKLIAANIEVTFLLKMLILLVGFQGSTKSTYAAAATFTKDANAVILSRDAAGGKAVDLLPAVKKHLAAGQTVIIDNTNLTKDARKPFIDVAKELNKYVKVVHFDSPIEDCQIRILHRMYKTHGEIFMTGKVVGSSRNSNNKDATKDPHVFPIAALFAARKNFEMPAKTEGIDSIETIKVPKATFKKEDGYVNKALFLDIDGTLRETEDLTNKYPTKPSECKLITDRETMRNKLDKYIADGYDLIGVSNQSGIAKGVLTEKEASACFDKTLELLGYTDDQITILFCPHRSVPISCYCRKPQSGLGMWAIENYMLNPEECIMVGDRGTDKSFAERLGFKFIEASKMWN
jgi:HAD superfamily hydrolase (TIGR01662 family)